jgi:hypothetical protein
MAYDKNELGAIADSFSDTFRQWDIRLPSDAIEKQERGTIKERGWFIQYLFGSDKLGPYLDYYAAHRMTEDHHVRLRPDGTRESLPSIIGMHVTSADPVEAKRLDDEHIAKNQSTKRLLAEKGFGLTINAELRSGLIRDEEP